MCAQQLIKFAVHDASTVVHLGLASTFVLPVVAHSHMSIDMTPIYFPHDIFCDFNNVSPMTLTVTWKMLMPSHFNCLILFSVSPFYHA